MHGNSTRSIGGFGAVPSRLLPQAAAKPLPGRLGQQIRNLELGFSRTTDLTAAALSKSCLYFSPENIAALGGVPDLLPEVEQLETIARSLLCHIEMTPAHEARLERILLSLPDLHAAAASAQCVSRHLYLLHACGFSPSGKALLRRPSDLLIRLFHETASAIARDCTVTARTASRETFTFEALYQEIEEMLAAQSEMLPVVTARLARATFWALGACSNHLARVAYAFSVSPDRAVATLRAARSGAARPAALSLELNPLASKEDELAPLPMARY